MQKSHRTGKINVDTRARAADTNLHGEFITHDVVGG